MARSGQLIFWSVVIRLRRARAGDGVGEQDLKSSSVRPLQHLCDDVIARRQLPSQALRRSLFDCALLLPGRHAAAGPSGSCAGKLFRRAHSDAKYGAPSVPGSMMRVAPALASTHSTCSRSL
jgi:hypothetical protein